MRLLKLAYSPLDTAKRHAKLVLPHLTPRRAINLARLAVAYSLRRRSVGGNPAFLKIEPTSTCQLRCLGCRSGPLADRISLDSAHLSADLYERLLDAYAPWLLEISFYLWGEPLLCRQLSQFVKLAQRRNIATTVSTNLNTQRSERLEELVLSGLNHLIVCLDGMSEETYQAIRIGGSYALAMGNLEHVVAFRRSKRPRPHPSIEWQYVVTDFNKHELPFARRKAKELGIEVFTEIADWGRRGENDDLVSSRARMRKRIKDHCWWPWFGLAIQANGDLSMLSHCETQGVGHSLTAGQ